MLKTKVNVQQLRAQHDLSVKNPIQNAQADDHNNYV
jgi:hypothetical protein